MSEPASEQNFKSPPIAPLLYHGHRKLIERIISLTLQIGVVTSVALVLLGTILTFAHHPEYVTDPAALHRLTTTGNDFPATLRDVFAGLMELRGQAVIVLGLMVLVATPVLRVAISVFIFLVERDMIFVLITLFVLAMLAVSFFVGGE